MEDRHAAEIFGISANKFRRAKYPSQTVTHLAPPPIQRTPFVPRKPPISVRIVGFFGYLTTQLSVFGLVAAVVCGYKLTLTHGVVIGTVSVVAMILGFLMITLYHLTATVIDVRDRAIHSTTCH